MATAQLGAVLRHIQGLAANTTNSARSDGDLLRAFLSGNDHRAFEALLRRHGPMVLRVCRPPLGNTHGAEAARRLGLEEGTVWNRLGRARRQLQKRLTRQGVTLPTGLLAALLGQNTASAVVPAPLVVSTARAAMQLVAGQALECGLVS